MSEYIKPRRPQRPGRAAQYDKIPGVEEGKKNADIIDAVLTVTFDTSGHGGIAQEVLAPSLRASQIAQHTEVMSFCRGPRYVQSI